MRKRKARKASSESRPGGPGRRRSAVPERRHGRRAGRRCDPPPRHRGDVLDHDAAVWLDRAGLAEGQPAARPELSHADRAHRVHGAAPSEIETLITEPVEEAVGVVKSLRTMKSVSRTGQSDVVLEFAWGTDMDQAGLEVRDKMEVLQLPLEAEAPVL